jgi:N-acetylglucosaminyl-diphospho-decaprenol L-rhamnosyltransferase
MRKTFGIDVVIPNWNAAGLLADCLAHLERDPTPHTTIVVDNGSTDNSVALVKQRFPSVRLVELPENVGFGRAVNRGIASGKSEIVVLLNNDANVQPGFLRALAAPFEDERVGMAAGVLLDKRTNLIDAAGIEIDRGLSGSSYMGAFDVARLKDPPRGLVGPCGGAAAYRRAAVDHVGGFDEHFFAYSEDLDLAFRLLNEGWLCSLAPGARALHVGSATLGVRTVQQVSISSFSRGYVLGRYRVPATWVATEFLVGVADSIALGSLAPLSGRTRGWIRGRRLPARSAPGETIRGAIGWSASLRRRVETVRRRR